MQFYYVRVIFMEVGIGAKKKQTFPFPIDEKNGNHEI